MYYFLPTIYVIQLRFAFRVLLLFLVTETTSQLVRPDINCNGKRGDKEVLIKIPVHYG